MNTITLRCGLLALLAGSGGVLAGPPTASERAAQVVEATAARGLTTPTIRQIMLDQDWVARSPSGAYWDTSGESVLFRRAREGSSLTDQYRLTLDGLEPDGPAQRVADRELAFLSAPGGDYNADRTWKIAERSGDLVLTDVGSGAERQLTRTRSRESGPRFVRGGLAIAFERDGATLVRDMLTGVEEEVADLRAEDKPKDDEDKPKEGLEAQQERLFAIVRDREQRSEEREDRQEEIREANVTDVAGPFYLGKDKEVARRTLSDDTRWLAVTLRAETKDAKRDEMPAYVNADGYVSTSRVRTKVGIGERAAQTMAVIDRETETVHEIDFGDLPMVRDDPLAWLKEKDEEEPETPESEPEEAETEEAPPAEPAEEVDLAEAADAGIDPEPEADTSDDAEPEDKPEDDTPVKARDVSVMRTLWAPSASRLAVMIRSNDNKDRWVVVYDVASGEPEMTLVEHHRDEAWINWRYNEMGWTQDGRLWFTSEATGHGALFIWDGETPERISGEGRFTVQSVGEGPDGDWLYFRSNRNHPTEYELERVSLDDGTIEAITNLGRSVDGYTLSPDGGRVLLTISGTMDPPELYAAETTPGAEPVRLTETDENGYRAFDWVEPEFVEVPSSHSPDPIHSRLYVDPDAPAPGGRATKPVVVFVHGAGYTQHVYKGWSYYAREHMFHTLLARAGYVVIAPDFRASAGYGRDWRTDIYRRMGEPELEDFDDCLAWLDANHDVDLDRVGLYGGSYGGFMAIMAMFDRPGVYAAGAALRPVTDWMHYNHGYTANILNTPDVDPEAYLNSSPIEKAEGFEGRLLICHGMLDNNVVAQDSIRLAQRLIELEKENWELALYPVEPHGFTEPTGWLDEYRRIFRLFEEELAGP